MRKLFLLAFILSTFTIPGNSQPKPPDSLLTLLSKAKEDSNKVMLYFEAGASIIYRDPVSAMPYFRKGAALSNKLNFYPGLEKNYTGLGLSNALLARYDSNLLFSDTAVFYANKAGDPSRQALTYLNRADVKTNLGMFNTALNDCDTALHFAEISGNKDRFGRIYMIFSSIYKNQRQYGKAEEYLDKALVLHKDMGNPQMEAQVIFYKAILNRHTKNFEGARENMRIAIRIADSIGDIQNLPNYYNEYAVALLELNNPDLAYVTAKKGLDYAVQLNNFPNQGVLLITLLHIYEKMKNYNEAIRVGEEAYAIFKKVNNIERIEGSAHSLSKIYYANGNYKKAYDYVEVSRSLNDSLLKATFDKETSKLQTVFQVAEKNKEIELLSKDKELKEQQLNKRNIIIAGSILLLIVSLIGTILIINRNKLKRRISEMQLRNEIAADLHDEVGSSLSSIRMLSEMAGSKQDAPQKEILNKVSSYTKETMEKMGDIVWMIKPSEEDSVSLKERMHGFLTELCEGKNIQYSFEGEVLETIKLNMNQRKALYLVFKEAVNNALKYSEAGMIKIQLKTDVKNIYLTVTDDGKGFDISRSGTGNGLGNMQRRAIEQKGQTAIQSAPGSGTTVSFMMPL